MYYAAGCLSQTKSHQNKTVPRIVVRLAPCGDGITERIKRIQVYVLLFVEELNQEQKLHFYG